MNLSGIARLGCLLAAGVLVPACGDSGGKGSGGGGNTSEGGTGAIDAPTSPDSGGCPSTATLTITSTSPLAAAQVGKAYSGGVDIKGGVLPYTFEITPSKRPPGLAWLTLDRNNGALSGVPMAASDLLAFEVRVSDGGSSMCQQVATKSLEIRVDRCVEGETVDCFVSGNGTCSKGSTTCKNGTPGDCEKATSASSDLSHCGTACGACDSMKADRCAAGKCQCGTGLACEGSKICCTVGVVATCIAADSDDANCGMCNRKCEVGPNAKALCVGGNCSSEVMCLAGFDRCDANHPKACPTAITTDVKNCGSCGNICPIPSKASACEAGKCVCGQGGRQCTGASEQCCSDSGGLNTACADLNVGVKVADGIQRCGSCGVFCPNPQGNGAATCEAGKCGARCADGWDDCDNFGRSVVPPRNCGINLGEDPLNCGGCGKICPGPIEGAGTAICKNKTCAVKCAEGLMACPFGNGTICVNTQSDTAHCGGCGQACSSNNVSLAVCSEGRCKPKCIGGFGDCETAQNNGCETPLNSINQCAACGRTCSTTNIIPMCSVIPGQDLPSGDVCGGGTCGQGFDDCNKNKQKDGCESNLASLDTCGSCGNRCPQPNNFTATCSNGNCGGQCKEGYTSCNGQPTDSDGCETDIYFSGDSCGGCQANKNVPNCPAAANTYDGNCHYGHCTCKFGGGWDSDNDPSNGCDNSQ